MKKLAIVFLVIVFLMALPVQAATINETVENALLFGEQGEYGQVKVDLRYRYEHVHIITFIFSINLQSMKFRGEIA
jgi:hypothetical protein